MNGGKKAREARDVLLVNLSACKYPLVREAAERLGYEVVDDEAELWDLFWSDLSVSADRVHRLLPFQRLNHFPGMLEICRKAALSRHMARMASRMPADYRFYPTSLVLPDQLDDLMATLKRNKARADAAAAAAADRGGGRGGEGGGGAAGVSTFILKPSSGTQGRGIALVQYPSQLTEVGDLGSCVAQAYVASPLLLDGFKFDLRVYALVASVDPLRIHLYDEGLARLATQPYKPPSPTNLRATTMHLTNYAVNKTAAGFVSADTAPAGGGSKRPMSAVLAQLAAQYGTTQEALRGSIADVVTKTVMAIQPLLAHTYHTSLSTAVAAVTPPACSVPFLDHMTSAAAAASGSSGSCSASCAAALPCGCPPSLCFELLGFDIMFDTHLQPWLLEVNHSPSFGGDSRLDRAVKGEMLALVMQMLGQQPEARRIFLEAEARAQSERLYSSPAGAVSSSTAVASGGDIGNSSSSYNAPGAVMRRAQSALPRSRQLQAAAAAMEEISANSTALLAAGGHVWGGGSGGSSSTSTATTTATTCNACYNRPASSSAASPRGRGGGAAAACATKRSLSCGSSGGCSSSGGYNSLGTSSGSFKLVFPTAREEDRKRYYRILQTAADLYPQQRCQCPWCSRRREISLIALSRQQLGLAARPSSAAFGGVGGGSYSHGLSGHLPARPGALSAQRRRSGLPAASAAPVLYRGGSGGGAAAGAEDGGSDTEEVCGHHNHLLAPCSLSTSGGSYGSGGGGGASAAAQPRSGASSSHDLPPRGKPPRPGSEPWPPSRCRSGAERQCSGSGANFSASQCTSSFSAAAGSYGGGYGHIPPFPAPPTIASVLAGCAGGGGYGGYGAGHGYGGGSAARTVLQQRRSSAALAGGGSAGLTLRHLSSEESAESSEPLSAGYDSGGGGVCGGGGSSCQLGRSAAAAGGGRVGFGIGFEYGSLAAAAAQFELSEDGNNQLMHVQHYSNGNGNGNHLLDVYSNGGITSPRLSTTEIPTHLSAGQPDAADATDRQQQHHQQQQPNPHARSNQLLSALRPLSHSKSHPQTRLGSRVPHSGNYQLRQHHSHQHHSPVQQQQQLKYSRYSGRQEQGSSRGSRSGGGSGGGGGNVRRSCSVQRRPPQRRGAGGGGGGADDAAAYGSQPSAPPPLGGGGSGSSGGGGGREAAPWRAVRPTNGVCHGGSADSSEASSDDGDGGGGGLRRSLSCGELGVQAPGHKGRSHGQRPGPSASGGGAAAAAAPASAARPWLAATAGSGGYAGGATAVATLSLLTGQGHGILAPSLCSRTSYGSAGSSGGGGNESGHDVVSAAAGNPAFSPDATASGKGLSAATAAASAAAAGGTAGSRARRFSGGPRRQGSASGTPMSAADLELLLVRAKTSSVLNNRFVSVYLQGGAGGGGGGNGSGNGTRSARSPR